MENLTDWVARIVERTGVNAIGVTLIVDGNVVSGMLTGKVAFFASLARELHRAVIGESDFSADAADDFENLEAGFALKATEGLVYPVLHLRDALIVSKDAFPLGKLPFFTVSAAAVTALAIGRVGEA